MASNQAEKIRAATQKSLANRDLYDAQVAAGLTSSLKDVQEQVSKSILKYRSIGNLPENKLAALTGLEKLQREIDDIFRELKKNNTLVFRKSTREAFRLGITGGIGELTEAAMPFYKDLTPNGIDKLSTKVFTLVDTDALDFMTQYNLTLAGDVHRELSDGIKRVLQRSIIDGKGTDDIVRELGQVVQYKDSFRQAGTKLFSKVQYRLEMIVRTEIIRAHNMGRMKFFEEAGVKKAEWMTMADERTCRVCGPLDGKVFELRKFPQLPAHPFCRCMSVVSGDLSEIKPF